MKRIYIDNGTCEFCKKDFGFEDTLAKKSHDHFHPCKQCRAGFKFRWLNFLERLRQLNFRDILKRFKQPVLADTNPPANTILKPIIPMYNPVKENPLKSAAEATTPAIVHEFKTVDEQEFQDFCNCVKKSGVVMKSTDGKTDILLYPTDVIPAAIKPGNIPWYRKMSRREKRKK